jgi:hypothetical protein
LYKDYGKVEERKGQGVSGLNVGVYQPLVKENKGVIDVKSEYADVW